MTISPSKVMEMTRIDDLPHNRRLVEEYIGNAQSSLMAAIGDTSDPVNPVEFEQLSNQFIVEYVRKFMTGADNDKILTSLAAQCEALAKS